MLRLKLIATLAGLLWLTAVCCDADERVVIATSRDALSPRQPQAAIASDGSVHVVFGVGDVVHHVRLSRGQAPEPAAPAFRVPHMSLGMRRGPRIVMAGDVIVVTAIGGAMGRGRDGDLLAWRSTDQGKSWEGPARVNDVADAAREGLHAMASHPDGTVWCTWLDLRAGKTELYAARSADGGTSWESNLCVYRSPDGSICECCHPSIAVSNAGVHVMFRNSLAGSRDMYLTSLTTQGRSFSPAMKLGQGTWNLEACPMDGGMLAAVNGTIETVWRREGQIYLASDQQIQETLLGRGQQPWMAASPKGTFVVWTTGREGDLMLRRPGSNGTTRLAQSARDPMLVSSVGKTAQVVCCWEGKRDSATEIVVQWLDSSH